MNSPKEFVRVAIAGASSLLGKELKQYLDDASFPASDIRLLDEEFLAGTLTESGGEPAVIETVSEDSFEQVRFVFFTGSAEFSRRHASEARRAGAVVIDLSGGLAAEDDARFWLPSLDAVLLPPETTSAGAKRDLFVVPSGPADAAISICAALAPEGLERLQFTFLQSVSELGQDAIEELESQVVKLLSFQPIPKTVFDAQVGFNLLSSYGPESGVKLARARARIAEECRAYLAGRAPLPAVALIQAPVFYSHAFMAFAEFKVTPSLEALTVSLQKAGLKMVAPNEEAPNNVNVAGELRPVLKQPDREGGTERGIWLWGAADNLRVPAATAVSIAEKLLVS